MDSRAPGQGRRVRCWSWRRIPLPKVDRDGSSAHSHEPQFGSGSGSWPHPDTYSLTHERSRLVALVPVLTLRSRAG